MSTTRGGSAHALGSRRVSGVTDRTTAAHQSEDTSSAGLTNETRIHPLQLLSWFLPPVVHPLTVLLILFHALCMNSSVITTDGFTHFQLFPKYHFCTAFIIPGGVIVRVAAPLLGFIHGFLIMQTLQGGTLIYKRQVFVLLMVYLIYISWSIMFRIVGCQMVCVSYYQEQCHYN